MSKEPHDILIGEDYTQDGEEKTKWHRVGVCFEDEALDGGYSGHITKGIALSGKFIIRKRRKNNDVDGGTF